MVAGRAGGGEAAGGHVEAQPAAAQDQKRHREDAVAQGAARVPAAAAAAGKHGGVVPAPEAGGKLPKGRPTGTVIPVSSADKSLRRQATARTNC